MALVSTHRTLGGKRPVEASFSRQPGREKKREIDMGEAGSRPMQYPPRSSALVGSRRPGTSPGRRGTFFPRTSKLPGTQAARSWHPCHCQPCFPFIRPLAFLTMTPSLPPTTEQSNRARPDRHGWCPCGGAPWPASRGLTYGKGRACLSSQAPCAQRPAGGKQHRRRRLRRQLGRRRRLGVARRTLALAWAGPDMAFASVAGWGAAGCGPSASAHRRHAWRRAWGRGGRCSGPAPPFAGRHR